MRYVVVWTAAKFLINGKRVVVTKGHEVPAGVDGDVLHQLVLAGAIVAASPPATSVAAAAAVDPLDPGEVTRPGSRGTVPEWQAWAAHLGMPEDDYAGLRKDELVAAVTEYEASLEPGGDSDDEPDSGEDDSPEPDQD